MINWCSDMFNQWAKAHAVPVKNDKRAHLSLCGIRPYGGWLHSSRPKCKNCLRELEKLIADKEKKYGS